jgi:hypothetical protein
LRAWESLYSAFLDPLPQSLGDAHQKHEAVSLYLQNARQLLSNQRDELLAVLRSYKLDDGLGAKDRGGIFVLAKLAEHFESLAKSEHLLVNTDRWSRLQGWSRLCVGLPEPKFADAVARLKRYLAKAK